LKNNDQIILTVCICCRNASSRIEETLLSLYLQTEKYETYEVLVVDNASDDINELKKLIEYLNNQFSLKVRIVEEFELGLSAARNRGVIESNGQYVFFIDDDALASARLVQLYIQAIQEYSPDVIGGNVKPLFEKMPPSHFTSSHWSYWSIKYFGSSDKWLEDNYFIGTNMGAKKEVLMSTPFDEELGRKDDSLVGGEDWILGRSELKKRFVSGAYVLHKVTKERMTSEYFAKRYIGYQITKKRKVILFAFLYKILKNFNFLCGFIINKVIFDIRVLFKIYYNK
jgi:glucosyl-dolichyl phosphate glucuronosyltransferase